VFHKRLTVRGSSRVVDPADFPAGVDSPLVPWNTLGWCDLDQWAQAKIRSRLPNSGLPYASLAVSETVRLQRGFPLGRILDLLKQGLSISGVSSRRQQTAAPLRPCSQRMSGMQSQMVRPLPILRPDSGRSNAKRNPLLCSLPKAAETGNARGLGIDEDVIRDEDLVAPDSRRAAEGPLGRLAEGE
jgi:hypothetical protein